MQGINWGWSKTFMNAEIESRSPIIKGFKSLMTKLLLTKSSLSLLLGDNSLQAIGELAYGLLGTPSYSLMAQYLNQDPACAALIRERYIAPTHEIKVLLALPPNSLGYIYAEQMVKTGFDPNLHNGMASSSDAEYVELRLSQTHDLWHIVTGFDTSPTGEIGLQAFHLPQFPYPLATMLVGIALISSTLGAPEMLPELLDAITKGFLMGRTAKPLFAQKWEQGWEKPLSQWRAELNIEPIAHT
jgi:ubiquinone biosynthesis protein COQ4